MSAMDHDHDVGEQLDALLRQVEFFFSDANLSKDRHMSRIVAEHALGYVSLEHIATFNTVQRIVGQGNAASQLTAALKLSNMLQVSEDGTMVKRVTPVVTIDPKLVNKRTVFVEHIGEMDDHDKLSAYFGTAGEVVYISLPRFKKSREPKGFAFVEYSNTKDAKRALKELNQFDPAHNNDKKLRVITKSHWLDLRTQYKIKMWRIRREHQDEEAQSAEPESASLAKVDANDSSTSNDAVESGVLVRVTGVDPNATKSDIIGSLGVDAGTVRYVDHKRGKPNAIIRLYTSQQATDMVAAQGSAASLQMALLQGDEEEEYWMTINAKRAAKKAKKAKSQGDDCATDQASQSVAKAAAPVPTSAKRPRNDFEAHGVVSHLSFLSDDEDGEETTKTFKRIKAA